MRYLFTILLFVPFYLFGQPWHYDFGTGTGSWTSGSSTTFLPQAPSGEDYVRVGSQGGSLNLDNPGDPNLGTGSELRIIYPTGSSVNKFSIYDYDPGKGFTIRYSIKLTGGTEGGEFYFFQGNGATFTNAAGFNSNETFTGIKWELNTDTDIKTYYRNGSSWTILNGVMTSQGTIYLVDIYGNNGTTTITYHYNGNEYSVASNKWDLWVNGTLVADELNKSNLTDNTDIDSYMFYGANSTNNTAQAFIDDIYYTNIVSDHSLPVTLSSFNAQVQDDGVLLMWQTASEVDNLGFEIFRSLQKDDGYQLLSSFRNNADLKGLLNSSAGKTYRYLDQTVQSGQTYYYKLADVSLSGARTFHGPLKVLAVNDQTVASGTSVPQTFKLYPNTPNPFNPSTQIVFDLPAMKSQTVTTRLEIFNIQGQKVRTLLNGSLATGKQYRLHWDGKDASGASLPGGIYIAFLKAGQYRQSIKMCLVR